MPATSEARRALATIGLVWSANLPEPAAALHDRLTLGSNGLWYGAERSFPEGLTLTEALGLTLTVAWAAEAEGTSVRYAYPMIRRSESGSAWSVRLPGTRLEPVDLATADARELADALLTIRRTVWPSIPWRPRDMIAEHLERHIRLMDAELRGPTPTEVLTPYVAASDVGRSWS